MQHISRFWTCDYNFVHLSFIAIILDGDYVDFFNSGVLCNNHPAPHIKSSEPEALEFLKLIQGSNGEFVKNQQCKKATTFKFDSFLDQRWKLDGNMLKNKAGIWKSDDLWIFKTKENDLIYIENTSNKKVLGATRKSKVNLEDSEEGRAQQLWKKGKTDAQGYFTLENFEVPKVITAISESDLEIKGNLILR